MIGSARHRRLLHFVRATLGLVVCAVLVPSSVAASGSALPSSPDGGWAALAPKSRLAPPAPPVASMVPDAVLVVETGETFSTIQEALDDPDTMDGHTLEVQVPVLPEGQTTIAKSVTLTGATGSEVVEMNEDTGASGDDRAWFLVQPGVDLTVTDLTFDGAGFLVYQAFRHQGTGLFEGVAFRDIQYQSSGPAYAGTAVVAFGGDVTVRQSTFEQIGRVGVLFFGGGVTDGVFEDNVYVGKGVGDHLDYGVEYGAGAQGTARGNSISQNLGQASTDGSISAGVLVSTFFGPGTAALVESNDLLANTVGLQVGRTDDDSSVVQARCNRIVGNWAGVRSDGLVPVDAENNSWGCNEGPGGDGCDTTLAIGAPIDSDPWLVLEIEIDPDTVPAGGTAEVTATLTDNSDGVDISPVCTVPDALLDFEATGGTLDPESAPLVGGVATTTFFAPNRGGTIPVTATVDGETVAVEVEVLGPSVLEIPTAGTWGLLFLGLGLGIGGMWVVGRG